MSVKFYYAPQSNASRIHTALQELGVKHEVVKVDLRAGDQKKPEFLALNPNGKVPTIVIDGTPMFESVAILIALGDRYGVEKGMWPAADSGERLEALTWLVWGQVTLNIPFFRYMVNTSDYFPKEQHNAAQAEAAKKDLHDLLTILDNRLKGREYIVGDHCTLVDLDIAGCLGWGLMFAKMDAAAYANITAWMGRVNARPSMQSEQHPSTTSDQQA